MGDAGNRSGRLSWRAVASVLVILLGARAFYLFAGHVRGEPLRPKVEVAAVWLVLAGALLVLSTRRVKPPGPGAPLSRVLPQPAMWLLFALAAFALYWPTIPVGLLSDDFLLWERAAAWDLSPVSSGLFRPLPLLVWAALINAGASGAALHILNILLHGTNAYLTTRLCAGWIGSGPASMLAGALMVVFPLASEPVSWPSGVFDLAMTALVLVLVLCSRLYEQPLTLARRAMFIGIGVFAMSAKETGVMASLVVLTDAWIRRSRTRHLVIDTAIVLMIAGAFAAFRILGAFGLKSPTLTWYRVQRSVFETFGGLAVPLHMDVVQQLPWLAIATVLILIVLVVTYFVGAGSRSDRFVFGAAAWILISVLPVFLFVFVAPDLQGARFLYLAGPAWTSLVAAIAFSNGRVMGRWYLVPAVGLVALWGIAARIHQAPWVDAAAVRDRIVTAVKADARITQCQTVGLTLTDNVRGAYVFRNGSIEALRREAGLHVTDQARPDCRFVWNEDSQAFSRAPE